MIVIADSDGQDLYDRIQELNNSRTNINLVKSQIVIPSPNTIYLAKEGNLHEDFFNIKSSMGRNSEYIYLLALHDYTPPCFHAHKSEISDKFLENLISRSMVIDWSAPKTYPFKTSSSSPIYQD